MDLKQEIYKYLTTQQLMSLATLGNYPWPAIVYFIADTDLNLYFISHPDDLHCQNILQDNRVAITIFESNQPNSKDKIGIQYSGQVEVVNILEKVKWMVKLWNKLIAGKNGFRPRPQDLLKVGASRVYRVKPVRIKFFNQALFPQNDFKLMEF